VEDQDTIPSVDFIGHARGYSAAVARGEIGPSHRRTRCESHVRYHFGMSRQVTIRLPDDLVQFIDGRVERGDASGRAAVVAAALERERRREMAERDAAILARSREKDDFDELAAFAARTILDDLA